MAAPQRKLRYRASWERTARERESGSTLPKRAPEREGRNRVRNARAFVVMVVVPMLLMLGSVYVHTLSAGLKGETARLEEEKSHAQSEGERLEVRITELSAPGRARELAREQLQMRDPNAKEIETYGRDGEDVVNVGEQETARRKAQQ
ncbi:MAG: cell division protein FtsL [Actinomycetota bacterium]|nr:cell division protein FtsL [Actinomycetota bacterium]